MYCLKKSAEAQTRTILPSKLKCLGCRSYFIQQQTLQLQNLHVQFKNYRDIPNISPQHQQIILRTIVAFLNVKGGAIYMGVEDEKCSVVGNSIIKNKQEEFRKFIEGLCGNVYPRLRNKEVRVDYVPVMKRNGLFTGKYVTKIIVEQGRTDSVYTIGVNLNVIGDQVTKGTVSDLRIGYVRLGVGGNSKLEDIHLFEQIYLRSRDPRDTYKLHQGCHPTPNQGNIQINTLGFKVQKQHMKKLASHIAKLYFKLNIPVKNIKQNYDGLKKLYTIAFIDSYEAEKVLDLFGESQGERDLPRELRFMLQGLEDGIYLFASGDKKSEVKEFVFDDDEVVQERKREKRTRWSSDEEEDYGNYRDEINERERYQREFYRDEYGEEDGMHEKRNKERNVERQRQRDGYNDKVRNTERNYETGRQKNDYKREDKQTRTRRQDNTNKYQNQTNKNRQTQSNRQAQKEKQRQKERQKERERQKQKQREKQRQRQRRQKQIQKQREIDRKRQIERQQQQKQLKQRQNEKARQNYKQTQGQKQYLTNRQKQLQKQRQRQALDQRNRSRISDFLSSDRESQEERQNDWRQHPGSFTKKQSKPQTGTQRPKQQQTKTNPTPKYKLQNFHRDDQNQTTRTKFKIVEQSMTEKQGGRDHRDQKDNREQRQRKQYRQHRQYKQHRQDRNHKQKGQQGQYKQHRQHKQYRQNKQNEREYKRQYRQHKQQTKPKQRKQYKQIPKPQRSPEKISKPLHQQPYSNNKYNYYQFTHIQRQKVSDLVSFIQSQLSYECNFYKYHQSLLIQMTANQISNLKSIIINKKNEFSKFGYNQNLIHGIANGHIYVEDFKSHLTDDLIKDVKNKYLSKFKVNNVTVLKNRNKFPYLDIEMNCRDAAEALDILISEKALRKYNQNQFKNRIKFLLQSY